MRESKKHAIAINGIMRTAATTMGYPNGGSGHHDADYYDAAAAIDKHPPPTSSIPPQLHLHVIVENCHCLLLLSGEVKQRMKLHCDVCDKSDASVFCSADEAALCSHCDVCVHCANKLTSRHQRFSHVVHQAKDVAPRDTCRDRAILCGECDLLLHTANEHAEKHDKFFLTGLMLSNCLQTFKISADESFSNGYEFDAVPDFNSKQ